MKHGILIMAGFALLCACSNNSTNTYDLHDSLGNKTTDTMRSGDTGYYERMNQKTGVPDTGSLINKTNRNDTGYYERLPNKRPDSTR